jgi:hypothetical protein
MRTVGEAFEDKNSGLRKAYEITKAARLERIAAAKKIAARDGITLEAALMQMWGV